MQSTSSLQKCIHSELTLCERLIRAIFNFQLKNGYIFSAWGRVRLPEHHVLIELDRHPLHRPTDLSNRLLIPLAQLTRIVASLKTKGLLKSVDGNSDRETLLVLTKEGQALSEELDDTSNQLMNLLATTLTHSEQRTFFLLWENLNNALEAPRTTAKPGDHPLRLQTRRFTRALGFFSKKSPFPRFTFPEINTLLQLSGSGSGSSLSSLAERMLVPQSTLRKLLTKLHEQSLCSRPSSRNDLKVEISDKGLCVLNEVVAFFAQVIESQLPLSVLATLDTSVALTERAVASWKPQYSLENKRLLLVDSPNYFATLQAQTLINFTQQNSGMVIDPATGEDKVNSQLIMVFDGPTPCFALRFLDASTKGRIHLLEYGLTSRAPRASCLNMCLEYFKGRSAQNITPWFDTNHLTDPLRSTFPCGTLGQTLP